MIQYITLILSMNFIVPLSYSQTDNAIAVPTKEETQKWIVKKFTNNLKGEYSSEYSLENNSIKVWYKTIVSGIIYLDKISRSDISDEYGIFIYGGGCFKDMGEFKDMGIINCIDFESEDELMKRMEKAFKNLARLNRKSKSLDEAL